jgi:ribosome biogenesis GTPase A
VRNSSTPKAHIRFRFALSKDFDVLIVKRIAVRNKIDLSDPAHLRAWTRRLKRSRSELKLIIDKVGDSVSAVMKEIELQKAPAVHDTAQLWKPQNDRLTNQDGSS